MNWKCVQTIQMIFKENILRAQKKKKKKWLCAKMELWQKTLLAT